MKSIRSIAVIISLISMTVAVTSMAAASSKIQQRTAQVIMDDANATVSTVEMDDDLGVTITIR